MGLSPSPVDEPTVPCTPQATRDRTEYVPAKEIAARLSADLIQNNAIEEQLLVEEHPGVDYLNLNNMRKTTVSNYTVS